MKIKTVLLLLFAFVTFATSVTVLAAVQYPDGGVWTYGATKGGAFSNYYHGRKYHSSTVVSREDSDSSKAFAYAGQTSKAFIYTRWGEKVAFYYDYY